MVPHAMPHGHPNTCTVRSKSGIFLFNINILQQLSYEQLFDRCVADSICIYVLAYLYSTHRDP